MINTDRIVNVQEIDLISLYGTILLAANISATKLAAAGIVGDFTQATNSATVLCDQPVKSFDFAATATAGTAYFVPATNYGGFKLAGVATETAGADVDADGHTLYKAVLSSGTVTITKIGF